ncbi:ABL110Wp [Eremothecium gossypii ATCC 10895]|uniref:mRNA export factor GLE1 n=1 Tax=Eremothecium gossypii (strain ATCC 10895 / CBS 109.51 / FGSC 9923 / NRRL Y-1056) TaxID=284811 RepID=Q75DY3_EREGS|nr:ABL110Wp [Eremothecium gossypii ATCC 10895]AAS50661.1 ABL110Wp [Eremothecium gossypii ATCC 10895]AEY94949.1 FABL110Wp [Eremothecium gossypii FDAG1]
MRFAVEELLDRDEPQEDVLGYGNCEPDGVQLWMPRKEGDKPDTVSLLVTLRAQLERMHISEKMPKLRMGGGVFVRPKVTSRVAAATTVHKDTRTSAAAPVHTMATAAEMLQPLRNKMEDLERTNRAEVERVVALKKKAEEERGRLEQQQRERAAREEQERRRREEEEQLRKIAREKQAAEAAAQREQAEKERLRQEAEARKEAEAEEAKRRRGAVNFQEVEDEYRRHMERIRTIKSDIVEPVKKDAELRKLLAQHKRKINPKFGQLTNSSTHLMELLRDMVGLIDATRSNMIAYRWILNFIAKAIVSQAETETRVKPETAVPLATLTLHLLCRYPELHELLLARVVKKCPFVIGYTCNTDTEEGRIRMGWKRNSDGKWEDETTYDERMGGMMTLYSVISRSPLPAEFITVREHPIGIAHSWKMLARLGNQDPALLTNTHFVLLGSWWDAAASHLLLHYGKQARKLLQVVADDLTTAVSDRKYVGAARLRILLEEWHQTGSIKSFPEMAA